MTTVPAIAFQSRAFPEAANWGVVYARALVRPVAACLLPVVLTTLVVALQGYPVQPFVWWMSGAALALASAWTTFRLQRTVAEIRIDGPLAWVRTIADCVRDPRGRHSEWEPVHDMRDYGRWCFVTVGLSSYTIEQDDWPFYEVLRDALRDAYVRQRYLP